MSSLLAIVGFAMLGAIVGQCVPAVPGDLVPTGIGIMLGFVIGAGTLALSNAKHAARARARSSPSSDRRR